MKMKEQDNLITLNDLRIRLKISKRKAAWMLQNQIIPCQINNSSTRDKYIIREMDVEAYLSRPPTERAREIPIGMFASDRKEVDPTAMLEDSTLHQLPLTDAEKKEFIRYLKKFFAKLPDAMTTKQVADAIGYQLKTVNKYVNRGSLYSVLYFNQYLVPKIKFIEFLASDEMFHISKKSQIHRGLILDFRNKEQQ
jgi:hypothetical protein